MTITPVVFIRDEDWLKEVDAMREFCKSEKILDMIENQEVEKDDQEEGENVINIFKNFLKNKNEQESEKKESEGKIKFAIFDYGLLSNKNVEKIVFCSKPLADLRKGLIETFIELTTDERERLQRFYDLQNAQALSPIKISKLSPEQAEVAYYVKTLFYDVFRIAEIESTFNSYMKGFKKGEGILKNPERALIDLNLLTRRNEIPYVKKVLEFFEKNSDLFAKGFQEISRVYLGMGSYREAYDAAETIRNDLIKKEAHLNNAIHLRRSQDFKGLLWYCENVSDLFVKAQICEYMKQLIDLNVKEADLKELSSQLKTLTEEAIINKNLDSFAEGRGFQKISKIYVEMGLHTKAYDLAEMIENDLIKEEAHLDNITKLKTLSDMNPLLEYCKKVPSLYIRAKLYEVYLKEKRYEEACNIVEKIEDASMREKAHLINVKCLRENFNELFLYCRRVTDLYVKAVICGYMKKLIDSNAKEADLKERSSQLKRATDEAVKELLKDPEGRKISGDKMKNYFYQIRNNPEGEIEEIHSLVFQRSIKASK